MINRSYRYKLFPLPNQEAALIQSSGAVRYVYNIALEQRRDFWRQYKSHCGKNISFFSQCRELTALRSDCDWIAAIPRECFVYALRDLEDAYKAFFAKRSCLPKFRKKENQQSLKFEGRYTNISRLSKRWAAVRLPKIGWVKFRYTRPMRGTLKNVTVSADATGWHISLAREIEHEAPRPVEASAGIDRGVTTTLALSTGEMWTMPASLETIEAQKRRAQRIVARRKRGSNRRQRAQRRVARLQARQARIRRDFHHRAALDVSRRFGVVVVEDLKTRNMTASARGTVAEPGRNVRQKAGLNRAILNAGWHQFAMMLAYKMEERGGQVVTVPAQFTSQTCAACGVVDARSRESQARFACISCGHTDHADINAAVNIERRWSTSLLDVEAGALSRPSKRQPRITRNPTFEQGDAKPTPCATPSSPASTSRPSG